ncbi:MAG: malonic semialdehyde reductase [Deltaproteobacteria bacterium]|nr:malonic semialdehyde reductase [Deltaproteobacteria bacterium]
MINDSKKVILDETAWRLLLLDARTHKAWINKPIADDLLKRLYNLVRMAPTAMNIQPIRLLFVKSREAKERLRPTLDHGNVDKTMAAPVTVIIAYDTEFYHKMPKLVPHDPDAGKRIAARESEAIIRMALASATLQAGYLILAARGLGLDCGPMGGFNANRVDVEFLPEGKWKSFLLLNLGYGDSSQLIARAPRLEFDEACEII